MSDLSRVKDLPEKSGKNGLCSPLRRFGSSKHGQRSSSDLKSEVRVRVSEPSVLPSKKRGPGRPPRPHNTEEIHRVKLPDPPTETKRRPVGRPPRIFKTSKVQPEAKAPVMVLDQKRRRPGRPPKMKPLDETETGGSVRVPPPSFEKMKLPIRQPKMRRTNLRGVEEREATRVLEVGQVWAFCKESDEFPRSYARIDRVIPSQSLAKVTLLIPHPVSKEELTFTEHGLSLACGMFKAAESSCTKDTSVFTHEVKFEIDGKGKSFYKIFPRKGQIWAIYLKWEDLKKGFVYKLVEIVSDFSEEDGVNAFGLIEVGERDGVYQREVCDGFHLARCFSRKFMAMFSHQVPASRIVEDGEMVWKMDHIEREKI